MINRIVRMPKGTPVTVTVSRPGVGPHPVSRLTRSYGPMPAGTVFNAVSTGATERVWQLRDPDTWGPMGHVRFLAPAHPEFGRVEPEEDHG